MDLDTAKKRIDFGQELKTERTVYEGQWEENARYLRPIRRDFTNAAKTQGGRLNRGKYDSTGEDALDNFAAGLYGTMNSPANVWFRWETPDPELNRHGEAAAWLDIVSARMLSSFRSSLSPFYAQAVEWILDLGGFGNGILFSDMKRDASGFIDRALPLNECYWQVNDNDEVDLLARIYTMTPRQIIAKFGKRNVSEDVNKAQEKEPLRPFVIQHLVAPNPEYVPGRFGPAGKPFVSYYDEVEKQHELSAGGFDGFPYMVPRWAVRSGEAYGRGPGDKALPHAKAVNQMEYSNLKSGARIADPTLNAPHEGQLRVITSGPGKINYGGMSPRGHHMVAPMPYGANLPVSLEMANQRREMIRDALYWSLMQLVGRTGMTATEVVERAQEKFTLMGPFVGRYQVEGLTPLLVRRFKMMQRAGAFPPVPQVLQRRRIEPTYLSPMAQAQKATEAAGVMRTFEFVERQAQIDPDVADMWNGVEATRVVNAANGAPTRVLRSDDELEARRERRQRVQMLAQGAEIADTGAGALEKFARAGQAAQQGAA